MHLKKLLTIIEKLLHNLFGKDSDLLAHNQIQHRITVYDNVLPEELFLRVKTFLESEGQNLSSKKTSFWSDFKHEDCVIEEMIQYLSSFVSEERNNTELVGAEWWVKYSKENELGHPLHKDIDDKYYFETKEVKRPDVGSVFYLDYSRGLEGNLVLFTSPYSTTPIYMPPEPNRLVVFDAGNLPHGVTNKDGKIVDRNDMKDLSASSTENVRVCVPINWWSNEIFNAKTYSSFLKEETTK